MVRRLAALTGAAFLIGSLAVPAHAQDAVVTQGDEIYVQKGTSPDGQIMVSACRIGFIQPDGRGLTAAHCGPPGAPVFDPQNPGLQIGTLAVPESYKLETLPEGGQWASNDYGYIDFLPGVVSGGNPITGDARADRALLNIGDDVCLSSQDGPICGPMVGIHEEELFFSGTAREGDSGGAVYSPELGFLGVMSVGGIKAKDPVTEQDVPILIASMGETGTSVISASELTTLFMNYLRNIHGENYTFSAPGENGNDGDTDAPQPVEISFAPPTPRDPSDSDGDSTDQETTLGQPRSVVNPVLAGGFGLLLLAMIVGAVAVKKRANRAAAGTSEDIHGPEDDSHATESHAKVDDYEEPNPSVS